MSVPFNFQVDRTKFNKREDKMETFSGYKKSNVLSCLLKAIKEKSLQKACFWAIELDISGHEEVLWKKLIDFSLKEINTCNPKLPYYLWNRTKNFISFKKNKEILITNQQ